MVFGYFGSLFYIGLLFTNAIAILNEERFLARSASMFALSHMIVMLTGIALLSFSSSYPPILYQNTVGWSTRVPSTANAGFGHSPAPQMFDTAGFGGAKGHQYRHGIIEIIHVSGAQRV
ncbi:hypothetical protein I306_04091 [Cryptococcus gattii EJB2]|uniref:Uncharacterized protein n=1 Tax=Cryptococcus gattii EJB2 TaxID=1296103 RepID=A0ABR5BU11_9TREE|nr:hypothetical protein I306_04091 [Cryptococcus gattii EJB2]